MNGLKYVLKHFIEILNNHLVFSTYTHKYKWSFCTENLVLFIIYEIQSEKILKFYTVNNYVLKVINLSY